MRKMPQKVDYLHAALRLCTIDCLKKYKYYANYILIFFEVELSTCDF